MRIELLPGVYLRAMRADKFKTACFSVNFLQQITEETAPLNALLPSVLLRGTKRYPDIQQISEHLDELYGASFGTLVRKKGDVVTCGFFADFVEDDFTPDRTGVFRAMTEFLREVLFAPRTDANGAFLTEFVESEKRNLINAIESRINDKRSYAVSQMLSKMCQGDPYGIPRLGHAEQAEKITPQSLLDYYNRILKSSQVEIFYMGRMSEQAVCDAMRRALADLPERAVRPVRVAPLAPPAETRCFEQALDVTQGKLCMGFQTGCTGGSDGYPALQLLNTVYGGGVNSKLFLRVREERSLCYYASSALERFKGIMLVSSGIDFDQAETVRAEVLRQLELCQAGEITYDELEIARRYLLSAWRSALDSPGRIDDFYLGQTICGDAASFEDWIAALRRVTKADVVKAARAVTLDTVYFLKGSNA